MTRNNIISITRSFQNPHKRNSTGIPLIDKWVLWKVGCRKKVCIGHDRWVGCDENLKFRKEMIFSKQGQRILNNCYHVLNNNYIRIKY